MQLFLSKWLSNNKFKLHGHYTNECFIFRQLTSLNCMVVTIVKNIYIWKTTELQYMIVQVQILMGMFFGPFKIQLMSNSIYLIWNGLWLYYGYKCVVMFLSSIHICFSTIIWVLFRRSFWNFNKVILGTEICFIFRSSFMKVLVLPISIKRHEGAKILDFLLYYYKLPSDSRLLFHKF